MRILLTGVTGVLGEPLAARLADDEGVEELVGVARGELPASLAGRPGIRPLRADFREQRVAAALEQVDVLVHGAFQPYGRDERALRAVNVDGSVALLGAALGAGVRHIVLVSSIAAYGSHPDNPVPLRESDALRPNPESFYSRHKAEVERALEGLCAEQADLVALRARPCILLGPRADPGSAAIRRYYHRIVPRFRGDHELYQFVATADAVEAIARATLRRIAGPLNITSGDWLLPEQLAAITGGRLVSAPAPMARLAPLVQALRLSPVGRDRIVLNHHPMVASDDRMRELTGVEPEASKDVLRTFMVRR